MLHFLRTEYAQKFEASGEPNVRLDSQDTSRSGFISHLSFSSCVQLNPMKLMQRLERIKEDLPRLKEDCLTLCTEKRVLSPVPPCSQL